MVKKKPTFKPRSYCTNPRPTAAEGCLLCPAMRNGKDCKGNDVWISTLQAAKMWGVSKERVLVWLREGRIDGAMLVANSWIIPADAKKPEDRRRLTTPGGRYDIGREG